MTDEELKEKMNKDLDEVFNVKSIVDFQFDLTQKAYTKGLVTGLKVGRPQWHDLRKDPNDLPKEPTEKMSVNETWAYVKFFDNTYGLVDKGALKLYKGAIAWCEIPTFDKE